MIRYTSSKIKKVYRDKKICPKCHKEIDTLFVFCPYCGWELAKEVLDETRKTN